MRRAHAVIGAAFGDEGKGLMTDYFVRQGDPADAVVVRFNGGAQAGHTVVDPDGRSHVFHHYGAGTLAGARTFLSQHFLVNPVVWRYEEEDLSFKSAVHRKRGPQILVDPFARVTTPYDMMANQMTETIRGVERHGSCGAGVHATMVRHESVPLFAKDLIDTALADKVCQIRSHYSEFSTDPIYSSSKILENFLVDCRELAKSVAFCRASYFRFHRDRIVFEGAQGLLLDEDCSQFFPHVTHSKTGLANVVELTQQMGIDEVCAAYVARTYVTRHGAGPLPGEDPSLSYHDSTNVEGKWQGKLRFAPFDAGLIGDAIVRDVSQHATPGMVLSPVVAITHCDQADPVPVPGFRTGYLANGPTYRSVTRLDQ